MITIKELTVLFGAKKILDAVSLEIPSHLLILGANGSGKSTLAKSLVALNEFRGSITLDGEEIQELSPTQRAKKIAYIPTKLEFYEHSITLEEFVLLGRFAYKKSFFEYSEADRALVEKQLAFLDILPLAKQQLDALSSGEQQLALIAQALTQESDTIIFDEPTANLDPHNTKKIAQIIKQLKERHQVILITHDIHLAAYFDAEVLFIKDAKAKCFTQDFFSDATLSSLYGAEFQNGVLTYV